MIPKPEKRGPKPKKPMRQIGKRTQEYNHWRDTYAIPHLDQLYGHFCVVCNVGGGLDVAHIKGRGSHPELKMVLSNVEWRCRPCHMESDSGFKY